LTKKHPLLGILEENAEVVGNKIREEVFLDMVTRVR